ncbi:MAG: carbohydrate ABC transporter permease [Spirochaetaceae bacterium]|jgi:raffinose/stachyose/melibiose transport system permease protein|nr:carbohydrate ABC transporter permease [Spirochaetaceae bacterium]
MKFMKTKHFFRIIISGLTAFVMFFPILTVILGGFKEKGQIFSDPFGIPNPPTLTTFMEILGTSSSYWTLLFNSILISGSTIVIVIVFGMLAGVGLSRIKIKGQNLVYNYFIMGLLFPLTVAILPLFLQLRSLGLIGTRLGVVLIEAAFNLPLSIFILTGFFRNVPNELQDACSIDGGTIFTFFRKVLIPLSTPVISTVTIIVFIASWNQFMLPLLVLSDSATYTIPLGVMQYQGQYASGWNQIMAFITLSMLPIAIFYFVLQRYVVEGLTSGAVKG